MWPINEIHCLRRVPSLRQSALNQGHFGIFAPGNEHAWSAARDLARAAHSTSGKKKTEPTRDGVAIRFLIRAASEAEATEIATNVPSEPEQRLERQRRASLEHALHDGKRREQLLHKRWR